MLKKLVEKYHKAEFNFLVRDVLRTPPLEASGDNPVIISMLRHSDILMYLLAVKSFYRRLGRGRIVIINDGTLDQQDMALLREHIRPVEFVSAASLHSNLCPSYISWKKLFCIVNFIKEGFAIQLDSDTLTVGNDLADVQQCIDTETSFILGTWANQDIVSFATAAAEARKSDSQHVQMAAERNFENIEGFETMKYIRGCSGFDGFARGLFDMNDLENFSQKMFGLIGDKWGEWGSEQTMSNILVANSPRARILPYPEYYNYWGKEEKASFIHFVGTYRYHQRVYPREARKVITELMQ